MQMDPHYRPPTSSVFEVNQRDIVAASDIIRRRNLYGTPNLGEVREIPDFSCVHCVM
jgi:hypothetical protein